MCDKSQDFIMVHTVGYIVPYFFIEWLCLLISSELEGVVDIIIE